MAQQLNVIVETPLEINPVIESGANPISVGRELSANFTIEDSAVAGIQLITPSNFNLDIHSGDVGINVTAPAMRVAVVDIGTRGPPGQVIAEDITSADLATLIASNSLVQNAVYYNVDTKLLLFAENTNKVRMYYAIVVSETPPDDHSVIWLTPDDI